MMGGEAQISKRRGRGGGAENAEKALTTKGAKVHEGYLATDHSDEPQICFFLIDLWKPPPFAAAGRKTMEPNPKATDGASGHGFTSIHLVLN
jgi:hypothetical protein